jgi:hypothetical protein
MYVFVVSLQLCLESKLIHPLLHLSTGDALDVTPLSVLLLLHLRAILT